MEERDTSDESKVGFQVFRMILAVVAWHAMLVRGKDKYEAMLDACDEVEPAINTMKVKGILPTEVVKQISE